MQFVFLAVLRRQRKELFTWSKDGTFVIADQFYRSIEDFQYDEEKQRKTPLTEYTFAAGELAKKYFNMIYSIRRNEI